MFTRKSHGFTLVELLVVIAIIGMLVGILLPAVQAARDAGRRTQNVNNLKNIGLAIASYAEAKSSLPPLRFIEDQASKKAGKNYPKARQSVSWAFELLPYLEQGNVYDRLDKTAAMRDPANAIAMRTPIQVYANPRQRDAQATCVFPGSSKADPSAARGTCLDYAANRGFYDVNNSSTDQFTMPFDPRTVGPFVHNALVTRAHVRDGLSSTIAVGDRFIGLNDPDEAGLAGASSSTIMRGPNGSRQGDGMIQMISPFPVKVEYEDSLPPSNPESASNKFGGPTASGNLAAFVFLDGHTDWFDYATTDPLVFRALCTIDGGEVIPQ